MDEELKAGDPCPSDDCPSRAITLREEALKLLKQAQAIDGMMPHIVMHHHEYGDTGYIFWSDKITPEEDEVVKAVLHSDFEPHKGEYLTVDNVLLPELLGLANLAETIL